MAGAGEPPQPRRAPQSGQPPPPTGAQQAPPRPSDHRAEAAAGGAEPPAALAARRGRAKARAGGADATHTLRGGGGARPEGGQSPPGVAQQGRGEAPTAPLPCKRRARPECPAGAGLSGHALPPKGASLCRSAAIRPPVWAVGQSAFPPRNVRRGCAGTAPGQRLAALRLRLRYSVRFIGRNTPVCPSMACSPST